MLLRVLEVEEEARQAKERTEELGQRLKEVTAMVRRLADRDRPPLNIYAKKSKKARKRE